VVPYLNVTALWDGAPDQGLMEPSGGRGFPYCALLTPGGEVIWEVRPTSLEAWERALQGATKLRRTRAALEKAPKDAALVATEALLDALGREQRPWPPIEELDAHAEVEGVDPQVRARFLAVRTDQLIRQAVMAQDGGAAALALFRDGAAPGDDVAGLAFSFYRTALEGAIAAGDAVVARDLLLDERSEVCGLDEGAGRFLPRAHRRARFLRRRPRLTSARERGHSSQRPPRSSHPSVTRVSRSPLFGSDSDGAAREDACRRFLFFARPCPCSRSPAPAQAAGRGRCGPDARPDERPGCCPGLAGDRGKSAGIREPVAVAARPHAREP